MAISIGSVERDSALLMWRAPGDTIALSVGDAGGDIAAVFTPGRIREAAAALLKLAAEVDGEQERIVPIELIGAALAIARRHGAVNTHAALSEIMWGKRLSADEPTPAPEGDGA